MTPEDIRRLAATEFQRSTGWSSIELIWRLLPLINVLLDQECGHHSPCSSYQEKYSGGPLLCPTGGQGDRELHPRTQRHKRC